jgi:dihydroorotate dehydrogenase electron transfer subunit
VRPLSSRILEVRPESPEAKTLRFDLNLDPAPGQYAMVWIRGVDEIPMSFSGPAEITVHSVGEATRALAGVQPGETVGLRGPLGNGFVLRGDRILLVGGGVGVAPLAFLGEEARRAGIDVTSLIGFRSARDALFIERLRRLGRTVVTTDDGSLGIRGFVSAGLSELDLKEFSQIYLCGPEPMMWDIIQRAREEAGRIQASINRHFKCALGICGSCCLDPDGLRVCVEGPVVMADRLMEPEFGRYRRGPSGGRERC